MASLPHPVDAPVAAPTLYTRTTRFSGPAAAALLDVLPPAPATELLSWVRRGEGLVGWGRAAVATASGPDRFGALQRWWRAVTRVAVSRNEVDLPGTGPVAFGSVAYAAGSAHTSVLVVPEVLIGRRGDIWWVTTVSTDPDVSRVIAPTTQPAPAAPVDVRFSDGSLTPGEWALRVGEAVRRITAGDLDKVVLARDLEVETGAPIDIRWLLQRLSERYDNTWVFAVDGLVGATPEMLVRREKGLVTSRVLAGTIRRSGDDAHDLALAASLARSSKDLEEHEYAVRSVAEALAPHCSSMNVPESPFVLHLSNVMHLATDVAGVLVADTSALGLAASLHPTAAVCGTPTPAADDVIAELEDMDRGRYAGPVGWMDATGDGEWGIALRCGQVETDPALMRLFAGCGIVAGSDPDAEVAESDAKLVPMRDALEAEPPMSGPNSRH